MKRYIAPVIIVLIVLAYLAFIASLFFSEPNFGRLKIVVVTVLTFIAGALIAVLAERIKEIKRGDEDDLSKY